jgi:mannose-6-phosphate isomerase-like protein (cupin superfamily)
MPSGYSGMSTGPFAIGSGATFTIPAGSRHVVL